MIVSIVGPQHCGSTMLYNTVRIIFNHARLNFETFLFQPGHDCENKIIKCHGFDVNIAEISHHIFMPIRDVRDSALTAIKRYPDTFTSNDIILEFCLNSVKTANDWENLSTVFIYEKYMENKSFYVDSIISTLGLKINCTIESIINEVDSLIYDANITDNDNDLHQSLNNDFYKKTFLTKAHVTSGGKTLKYKTDMSQELNDLIVQQEEIKIFLKSHGYSL